jgi:hypothetical protein
MTALKGKFHEIHRAGQEADIDELFEELFKVLGELAILTDKGDLLTHDGTNLMRLPVGTAGQVLTVDASTTAGIKWADAATPGPGGTSNGALRYWVGGQPWGVI